MNGLLTTPVTQTKSTKAQTTRLNFLDVSRGAKLLRIAEAVHLDAAVTEYYTEVDPGLGFNTAGTVLRVLSQHIVAAPGGGGDETLTVALRRRDDGLEVEVQLRLSRTRRAGQSCLVLIRGGERAAE